MVVLVPEAFYSTSAVDVMTDPPLRTHDSSSDM